MKFAIFQIFTAFVILLAATTKCNCAPNKNQERSLADNYTALTDDIKWFFRGISKFADTVEQMLPKVSTDLAKTTTFSEHTRITFLVGLRHLMVGIREIAITFEQNFQTDHVKQLHQLKNVSNFINELVSALKIWFSQIRALVVHVLHLYSRYIPEVLFGKCLGSYLATTYPERSYYEYPFILIMEIYSSITTTTHTQPTTDPTEFPTEPPALTGDLNMEQNEIFHSESDNDKTNYEESLSRQLSEVNDTGSLWTFASLLDFSGVLDENKDKIIEEAVDQRSWHICLKLYTAESISRSLKIFFLGL